MEWKERQERIRQVSYCVQQVLAHEPSSWHADLRPLQQMVEAADQAILSLPVVDAWEAFPEKGSCTIKARWEVVWLVNQYRDQPVTALGLDEFLHAYRVNSDLKKYRSIRNAVRILQEPHSVGDRIQGMLVRWCRVVLP